MKIAVLVLGFLTGSLTYGEVKVSNQKNYFLSPHLDDVVLTFGGLILTGEFQEKKNEVIVYFGLSNYTANGPHDDSSDARVEYVSSTRMREDHSALTQIFGGWANYTYTLHASREATLRFFTGPKNAGGGASGDFSSFRQIEIDAFEDLQDKIRPILKQKDCSVFVLASVGSHIDHFLVREAVIKTASNLGDKAQCQIYFGEDQPYTGSNPEAADQDLQSLVKRLNLEAMQYSIPVEKKVSAFKSNYFSQYEDSYIKGLEGRAHALKNGEQIYKWPRNHYAKAPKHSSCKTKFCAYSK